MYCSILDKALYEVVAAQSQYPSDLCPAIVRLLLDHGANALARHPHYHYHYPDLWVRAKEECNDPLLHIAAGCGAPGTARELLAHGADVNCVGHQRSTALHHACFNSDDDMIELLLGAGANPLATELQFSVPANMTLLRASAISRQ